MQIFLFAELVSQRQDVKAFFEGLLFKSEKLSDSLPLILAQNTVNTTVVGGAVQPLECIVLKNNKEINNLNYVAVWHDWILALPRPPLKMGISKEKKDSEIGLDHVI